jgi:hypothetical protein
MLVHTAKAGNEVILECANGTFSGIAAMDTRWHELELDLLIMEELFECSRAFVVKSLKEWTKASCTQSGVKNLVTGEDGSGTAILDGFRQDAVAIKVIDNDEVVVAGA